MSILIAHRELGGCFGSLVFIRAGRDVDAAERLPQDPTVRPLSLDAPRSSSTLSRIGEHSGVRQDHALWVAQ
jgi:hypothetical protein